MSEESRKKVLWFFSGACGRSTIFVAIEMRSHQNRKCEIPGERKPIHPPNIYERNGHFSRLSGGDKWTWKIPAQIFNQVNVYVCVWEIPWMTQQQKCFSAISRKLVKLKISCWSDVESNVAASSGPLKFNWKFTCYVLSWNKKKICFSLVWAENAHCYALRTELFSISLDWLSSLFAANALSRSRKLSAMCEWHKHGP